MILKLCPMIEYYIKSIFPEDSCWKCAPKASPSPLSILVNNPKQSTHAINSFKNKTLWKMFFLSNPVSFNGQLQKNKKGLELVTSRSSSYETSSETFLYYVLSDQVWWCNIKWFLSCSKNYLPKFMQAKSWHHKLLHFHLYF